MEIHIQMCSRHRSSCSVSGELSSMEICKFWQSIALAFRGVSGELSSMEMLKR